MTLYSWFSENNGSNASKNTQTLNINMWPTAKTRASLEGGKIKPVSAEMVTFSPKNTVVLKHKNA